MSPWQLIFSSPHPLDLNMWPYVSGFQLKATNASKHLYACWIIHFRHHLQLLKWNEFLRWPEMPIILGRSGTQYVAMVLKRIKQLAEISFVHHIWSKYDVIYIKKLEYLWNEKRYLKVATYLCFTIFFHYIWSKYDVITWLICKML